MWTALRLPRLLGARLDGVILRIDEDTARRPGTRFGFAHLTEAGDDDEIALARLVRRGAVDAHHAGTVYHRCAAGHLQV